MVSTDVLRRLVIVDVDRANVILLLGGHLHGAGHLICYEELPVRPILASVLQQQDVIMTLTNDGWTNGTSIPRIQ